MKKVLSHGSLLLAVALLMGSCTHAGDKWLIGTSGFAAQDQIMLVRQTPASFGFKRLMDQSVVHPDLGLFLTKKGVPDFLAETSASDRHYFILYYLKAREAFACRTISPYSKEVQFSGPYPITPREYKLLHGFRENSTRKMAKP